ncbi:MAG TPA: GIY-YIG nuclease family protein [Solirubrobacteraceae bacterium]|nr:GIY-YIG nuclease family protein [Solirubrobacteraceae bacterium]
MGDLAVSDLCAGLNAGARATGSAGPPAWVYLLRCADGSLYCGWTTDVQRRVAAHAAGRGSRYTRSRLPVALVLALGVPSRTAARRAEAAVKALTRAEKLALVAGSQELAVRVTGAG